MSSEYLLDTNAVIARFAQETAIIEVLERANEIFVPSIALGELYFGAEKSAQVEENLEQIEKFITDRTVLGCDRDTARWYGRINNRLRVIGRPIPANDVWIASIAMQYGLTVLTHDRHFSDVDGLAVESW